MRIWRDRPRIAACYIYSSLSSSVNITEKPMGDFTNDAGYSRRSRKRHLCLLSIPSAQVDEGGFGQSHFPGSQVGKTEVPVRHFGFVAIAMARLIYNSKVLPSHTLSDLAVFEMRSGDFTGLNDSRGHEPRWILVIRTL